MSYQYSYAVLMNLNREQFLRAVEQGRALLKELRTDYPELKLKPVFSRFGPRSGQCDLTTDLKEMLKAFPEMLVASGDTKRLRELPGIIKAARREKRKKGLLAQLQSERSAVTQRLINPGLKLYCGDVMIEYRAGILNYESLRCLQQDLRLPPELNEVGSIRVVVGSLELLDFIANEDG